MATEWTPVHGERNLRKVDLDERALESTWGVKGISRTSPANVVSKPSVSCPVVKAATVRSDPMLLTAAIVGLFVLPEPWNVIALCVAAVVEVGELYLWKRFLDRYRVHGGAEGMIGERGEVIETCAPDGKTMVRGEIWSAVAVDGRSFMAGERIRVTGVDGLTLRIDTFEASRV